MSLPRRIRCVWVDSVGYLIVQMLAVVQGADFPSCLWKGPSLDLRWVWSWSDPATLVCFGAEFSAEATLSGVLVAAVIPLVVLNDAPSTSRSGLGLWRGSDDL